MMSHLIFQSFVLFPVATPSGIIAFLHSDLRTFRLIRPYLHYTISSISIPRTPWNKKESKGERVLKGKLFRNNELPYYSTTSKTILKCNYLLYSSIYFLFNHIYILRRCCFVGRCSTCWIAHFLPSNRLRPTKVTKKGCCSTCWTSNYAIFFIVNLCN